MSMHTTQEWHTHAQFNMTQALHTQRKASSQCEHSKSAHRQTVDDNLSAYTDLHSSLEHKVKTSQRLIEKLNKRGESVESSIKQTQQSLAMLEAACRAKEPILQLCVWRMEQRQKRPLREQVRDNVEVCLEEQRRGLVDMQKKFQEAVRKTRAMIVQLEGKLEEVHQDMDQKSQALGVDEMCLRTTHRSFQSVVERSPRHTPMGSPGGSLSARLPSAVKKGSLQHQVSLHESTKNEVNRQHEATRLNQAAASREEMAKELRDENAKLAARCERAAMEAEAKTERVLQDRVNENQQMRRRLEGEIRETHQKMDHTKMTISETKSQIKSLEEPIELTSTCGSWRKQRATKEHITDPVSTNLSSHQNMLLKSHEELRGHHQHEKNLLGELNERRERLKEDLRDKTAALHIDLNCLTHEALQLNGGSNRNISKNKLSKALKVDPNFVPMSPHIGRGNFGVGSIPYSAAY